MGLGVSGRQFRHARGDGGGKDSGEGSCRGTWGLTGCLVRGEKAWEVRGGRRWGFWTEWDEKFVDPSRFCDLLRVFCIAML